MELKSVLDLLQLYRGQYRNSEALVAKLQGQWMPLSGADFVRQVDELSLGLQALGVKKGDRIGLISPNRPEWNVADFGIMQIGAVTVPLYPTLSEHDLEYICRDAGIRYCLVGGKALYERMSLLRGVVSEIFTFDAVENARSWEELKQLGREKEPAGLETLRQGVRPEDLLTLIYTSGTTGNPKGVMLTHKNIISNVLACHDLLPATVQKALSFLPLCHIFERMVCYLYLAKGITIHYAESIETIAGNIKEVKPHVFTTVPRLLEKVYDRIVEQGAALGGIKKALFFWALKLGLHYELEGAGGTWYELKRKLAVTLVFSKWQEALGGDVQVIISGGAALQPRLARVFNAAGIPVLQGYGLTETSPVIAVNRFGHRSHKLGSVGRPIDGVEVKIAEDGEILCRGDNVMLGYYKRPDLTAEEMDSGGWFRTGDLGRLDESGFLFITGRKKELFKTGGGKYVSPAALESKFKESILIEYAMVVGENRRFPAALIVPSFVNLQEWCRRHGIPYTCDEEMVKHPEVLKKYQQEIERYNVHFGHWEQVKKIVLMPAAWSIEAGELTPKLDMKRKVIQDKYADIIAKIYE